MKSNNYLIYGGIAIAGIWLLSMKNNQASTGNGILPLDTLTTDVSDLQRLNDIAAGLFDATIDGELLTDLQIKMAFAQILLETGILTSVANYNLIDNYHNYAGLTTTAGGYAKFNSVADFMHAYMGFLTKGSNPLGAANITDFNNRLVANHYYTDSPVTYGNNLKKYFNMINV